MVLDVDDEDLGATGKAEGDGREAVMLEITQLRLIHIAAVADVVDHEVLVGVPICKHCGLGLVVASVCGGEGDGVHNALQEKGAEAPGFKGPAKVIHQERV